MAKNEKTSQELAKIAAKLLKNPQTATRTEIQRVAGSLLTQVADKKKR